MNKNQQISLINSSVFNLEDNLTEYLSNYSSEAMIVGVDEVGRGALFGEVVAAAVILPIKFISDLEKIGVNDSKKLTPQKRNLLINPIKNIVSDWKIGVIDHQTIDQINIFQASLEAMTKAINQLKFVPELCLIDGKFLLPNLSYPQINLIKGDGRSPIIGAASIIAKVWRDELMMTYDQKFPHYDLANNKGYGTKKHLQAIAKYGVTPFHRLSFSPCQQSIGC